jgi:prepilin-type N-terminal cleavage/methylation domain-containing protein
MKDRKTRSPGAPRGFSLIELIVVVAIIAMIAAVALPQLLRALRNYRLRGAAQDVAGEIGRARGRAIATNANRGFLFVPGVSNPSDGTNTATLDFYQVWAEQDPASPGTFPPLPIGGNCPCPPGGRTNPPNGVVKQLPPGVFFVEGGTPAGTWGGHAVRFDRLGRACTPGSVGCAEATGAPPNAVLFAANGANLVVTLEERGVGEGPGAGTRKVRIEIEPGGKIVTKD